MSVDATTLTRALDWLVRERRLRPQAHKLTLVEEAAKKFDLGPLDEEWLLRQLNEHAEHESTGGS